MFYKNRNVPCRCGIWGTWEYSTGTSGSCPFPLGPGPTSPYGISSYWTPFAPPSPWPPFNFRGSHVGYPFLFLFPVYMYVSDKFSKTKNDSKRQKQIKMALNDELFLKCNKNTLAIRKQYLVKIYCNVYCNWHTKTISWNNLCDHM